MAELEGSILREQVKLVGSGVLFTGDRYWSGEPSSPFVLQV